MASAAYSYYLLLIQHCWLNKTSSVHQLPIHAVVTGMTKDEKCSNEVVFGTVDGKLRNNTGTMLHQSQLGRQIVLHLAML
jgi:hypothetical protein